jgi:hypothetical protein
MNRITLVDYIGYCDSKGEVTGHTAKTLKETKEMLSDSYDVSMVVTPPYMIISEMIKSAIEELHFVIRRQEKSIQILWRCIS